MSIISADVRCSYRWVSAVNLLFCKDKFRPLCILIYYAPVRMIARKLWYIYNACQRLQNLQGHNLMSFIVWTLNHLIVAKLALATEGTWHCPDTGHNLQVPKYSVLATKCLFTIPWKCGNGNLWRGQWRTGNIERHSLCNACQYIFDVSTKVILGQIM